MPIFEPFIGGIDFAEAPRWHDGRLWYSDFYQHRVYAVDDNGERETMVEFEGDAQPSGLGWMPDGSLLIVSMVDRKIMRWADGALTEHADLSDIATYHCNDMIVDAAGNAYVGNFGWDIVNDFENATTADLALVRPDGTVEVAATGLLFPNGMAITQDGSTLIVGETFGSQYRAYDIAADATLSNDRVWASVPDTAPDGCDLDAEGAIWYADARGGNVVRVLEGGEVTHTIPTGTGVFACALGGDDGRSLFALCAPGAAPHEVAGKAEGSIMRTTVDVPRS
jgi:sugar lactone lactonase YvrE